MRHMTVTELATRLHEVEHPVLLDVREPWEVRLAPFPGMTWIPMGQILERLAELDKTAETVVICHHGIRSWRVAKFLESEGFTNVINLTGGIDAWSKEIDPSVPLY
jgi:rhodanese-related sulfurtransferase